MNTALPSHRALRGNGKSSAVLEHYPDPLISQIEEQLLDTALPVCGQRQQGQARSATEIAIPVQRVLDARNPHASANLIFGAGDSLLLFLRQRRVAILPGSIDLVHRLRGKR